MPSPATMKLPVPEFRPESLLDRREDEAVRRLLWSCFPHRIGFRWRRHLGTPPDCRWLISGEGTLIAHLALYERVLGTEAGPLRAGGIGQVCVAPLHRGRGLARQLLEAAHEYLRAGDVRFAFLFGAPELYRSAGYRVVSNPLRASNALARRWNPFRGALLVRGLGDETWPEGVIDLNGPSF